MSPAKRSPAPSLPLAVWLGILLLRLWVGAFFVYSARFKWDLGLSHFVEVEWPHILEGGIDDPPSVFGWRLDFYADFLRDVMLPNGSVLGPIVLVAETALGVSLVFGIGVRLIAFLGFLMMTCFSLAKAVFFLTVKSANWPVTIALLVLCLTAAGRYGGLDALLRRRLPRWVS